MFESGTHVQLKLESYLRWTFDCKHTIPYMYATKNMTYQREIWQSNIALPQIMFVWLSILDVPFLGQRFYYYVLLILLKGDHICPWFSSRHWLPWHPVCQILHSVPSFSCNLVVSQATDFLFQQTTAEIQVLMYNKIEFMLIMRFI